MKNLLFLLTCSILLFACSDDNDNPAPENTFKNCVEYTFKTTSGCVYRMDIIGDNYYIDWGDGNVDFYEFDVRENETIPEIIKHTYKSSGTYNIKIQTDNLSYLKIDNFSTTLRKLGTFDNFSINSAPKLTSLDLGGFHGVRQYYIANCPLLSDISLYNNTDLEQMNFSSLTSLKKISLDGFTNLKTLNLENLSKLEELRMAHTYLEKYDFSNLTNLKKLYFNYSELESLDISPLTNLVVLSCENNNLSSIDISNNKNLEVLNCQNNQITTLNFDGTKLSSIRCGNNELISLSISNTPNLKYLSCRDNKLDTETLNRIFTDLPDGDIKYADVTTTYGVNILNNPGEPGCDRSLFQNKYWRERTSPND